MKIRILLSGIRILATPYVPPIENDLYLFSVKRIVLRMMCKLQISATTLKTKSAKE